LEGKGSKISRMIDTKHDLGRMKGPKDLGSNKGDHINSSSTDLRQELREKQSFLDRRSDD